MSGPGHSRPLLAARTSSGEASKDGNISNSNSNHNNNNNNGGGGATPTGPSRPPGSRPKRTLIESACSACRRRKSRCDGVRPSCSRCQNLRTECQYEAEEGESRWSALRRRNQILEHERDQIRELLAFVQTRPEPEAMEIFQRIRTSSYDDIFLLLRQIREGTYGVSPNMQQHMAPPGASAPTSNTAVDHRLPPIHSILDVSINGQGHGHHNALPNHVHLVHSHSLSSDDSRNSSVPEYIPGPSPAPPPHLLATLEPSLHQPLPQHPPHHPTRTPPLISSKPGFSSEESTGSMNSTTSYNVDPTKPYQTP